MISKERPLVIALGRTGKNPRACGIFCHTDSPYNTVYLLHDHLNRTDSILHAAAVAVRQVATFLANESAPAAAIKEIFLDINVKRFIEWYESEGEDRSASARSAALLRDLDDAAALVGECGKYRPDVKFVKSKFVRPDGRQMADDLAQQLLWHHESNGKLLFCDVSRD